MRRLEFPIAACTLAGAAAALSWAPYEGFVRIHPDHMVNAAALAQRASLPNPDRFPWEGDFLRGAWVRNVQGNPGGWGWSWTRQRQTAGDGFLYEERTRWDRAIPHATLVLLAGCLLLSLANRLRSGVTRTGE